MGVKVTALILFNNLENIYSICGNFSWSLLDLLGHASMIMWLDNRNIATVFVDLNVFNEYKRLLPSGIHLIKSSNSATNFTDLQPFIPYSYYSVYLLNNVTVFVCHCNFAISIHYLIMIAFRSAPLHSTRVKQ
jgi:hypothetical protein